MVLHKLREHVAALIHQADVHDAAHGVGDARELDRERVVEVPEHLDAQARQENESNTSWGLCRRPPTRQPEVSDS